MNNVLYALILVFPLGEILRIPLFSSVYVYLTDIVLLIISVFMVREMIRSHKNPLRLTLFKPLYVFIGWAFITLLLNIFYLSLVDLMVSFLYLVRLILYSNLLFVFHFIRKQSSRNYIIALAIAGFWFVLFGFAQYLLYPNLKNLYYLGWDDHLNRMFSTTFDPNFSGALFVLILILFVSVISETLFEWNSQVSLNVLLDRVFRKRMIAFLAAVGIVLSFVAVFLTYSRNSYFMLLVTLLSYFLLRKKRAFIIVIVILIVLGIILVPKNVGGEGVYLARTVSIFNRFEGFQNALTIFKDSPVWGVGFNAYRYAQVRYGFLNTNIYETHSGAGVSNSFLFLLATTGVVGLILFLHFWYRVVRYILEKKREGTISSYYASVVIASVIGIFIHSMFENTLFYPFVMIWIFTLIGSI